MDLRKDNITGASAEDIARMVGSRAPVIPPAPDVPDEPAPVEAEGAAAVTAPPGTALPDSTLAEAPITGDGILDGFIERLRTDVRNAHRLGGKIGGLLNGSCHAASWQDGVLTIAFHQEFHKATFDTPELRKVAEDVASKILGAPVTIRCIIAAKPAKALSKSSLVQHAVQNHGATIISHD